ncbi:putative quinol monooxygenase [Methanobrevibacter sp.]|uniref:putative quinol monooxygenase n=1 Tax=Methanobrevibacter sp. TaxID=66852 RepID=UPI003870577C
MDFILVLAKIYPKEGCKDTVIELSDDLIENTLSEEGNIDYQLLESLKDDTLTFVEKWQSPDALKKHMASPHFQNFGSETQDFVKKMDIQVIGAEELSL